MGIGYKRVDIRYVRWMCWEVWLRGRQLKGNDIRFSVNLTSALYPQRGNVNSYFIGLFDGESYRILTTPEDKLVPEPSYWVNESSSEFKFVSIATKTQKLTLAKKGRKITFNKENGKVVCPTLLNWCIVFYYYTLIIRRY